MTTTPQLSPDQRDGNSGSSPVGPAAVALTGLSKRFGPVQALTNVSLRLRPGTFHALLGENGAGKTTLVKCLMGVCRPDSGTICVGENEVAIKSPRQAHALGIGMVYQHFTLLDNMTVAENMILARDHLPTIIDWKREIKQLNAFMEAMPFRVKPAAFVRHFSAGEKQKVEILRQLYLHRQLLILDEPTSVLTPDEADQMLSMLRNICSAGPLSVLMISHKLREVTAFCDEVTVLRHGRNAGVGSVRDLNAGALAEMMMGKGTLPTPAVRESTPAEPRSEPRLCIESLFLDDDAGAPVVCGLSMEVKAHEIVGIAGVSGNGQAELVQALAGQRKSRGGRILAHGRTYRATRREMLRNRLHVLPETPLLNACVPGMTLSENLAFRSFDRRPLAWSKMFLNLGAFQRHARALIDRYRIRPPSPNIRIAHLSGGNIQRAVLARELGEGASVLIVANPCFGLDFRATTEIRSQIMKVRNRGAGVLLVSEDLDEILELADRVLVLCAGQIVYETPIQQADRQVIGRHMAGGIATD